MKKSRNPHFLPCPFVPKINVGLFSALFTIIITFPGISAGAQHFHPDCNVENPSTILQNLCDFIKEHIKSSEKQDEIATQEINCNGPTCEIKTSTDRYFCSGSDTNLDCGHNEILDQETSYKSTKTFSKSALKRLETNNGRTTAQNYITNEYCSDGDGRVSLDVDGRYIVKCSDTVKTSLPPVENEETIFKTSLCHGICADDGREFKKIDNAYLLWDITDAFCKCGGKIKQTAEERQAEREKKQAQRQTERKERNTEKQEKKQAECAQKDPPKVAKKNKLGIWVCADSDETIKARETEKQNNKTLKAFWDDIDALENAFNRRVRQLNKQGGNK